jgi:hypothetical protein
MALNQAQALALLNQVTQLETQLKRSVMPQAQGGMDASNLLKMIPQLRGQGNRTPKKEFSDSNNQAQMQMLINQISQMNALQQPQPGANPMATIKMMTQLQALQGVNSKNAAAANKGNVGVNDLVAALTGEQGREAGHCLWVTGLPEEYQDSQKLLNIFGNFGNVRRIVFSDKKPDGALIQMDNANSAMKARFVTRNQTIGGKPFNVTQLDPVKFKRASIGKEDKKSMDVTKAKENWRFAKDSKFLKICMARLRQLSPKIIVSNIPEGKEDLVKKHIIEAGYTVKSMEGSKRAEASKSGFTMQVIELASTEEAIGAVANLHNTWSKKMGTKNKDHFERERGLNFSFAGSLKAEREKAKASKK